MDKIFISSERPKKFQWNMWLMIILKFAKNQGFTLSVEGTFLEKPQGRVSSFPKNSFETAEFGCAVGLTAISRLLQRKNSTFL